MIGTLKRKSSVSEKSHSKSRRSINSERQRKIKEIITSYNHEINLRDIRIKTLENNLKAYAHQVDHMRGKSIEATTDVQSHKDCIENIVKLENQLEWVEKLKEQAVTKLHKVLVNPKIVKLDVKMNQAYHKLEFDLKQEKKKFANVLARQRKEMDDLRASLYELDQKNQDLRMKNKCLHNALLNRIPLTDGCNEDTENEKLDQDFDAESIDCASKATLNQKVGECQEVSPQIDTKMSRYSSNDALLKSFVSTPFRKSKYKKGWKRQFVVVCNNRIYFYDQLKGDDHSTIPSFMLPLNKIFHVRHVVQADARFADPNDVDKIFQLIYSESDRIVHDTRDLEDDTNSEMTVKDKSVALSRNGHDFIRISFQTPVTCEICSKSLWSIIKAPAAYECQKCLMKIHRIHVERADAEISDCRVSSPNAKYLLVLTSSPKECCKWVRRLLKVLTVRSGVSNRSYSF